METEASAGPAGRGAPSPSVELPVLVRRLHVDLCRLASCLCRAPA
ncbi:putative leader peptide [Thermomonospora catenispora]